MVILLLLFCLFIILPCAELIAFSVLGSALGVGPALLVILITGMVGAALAKQGGLECWRRINMALRRGEDPSRGMIHGLLIFIAGIALIIPGFITDIIGLLLLVPDFRDLIAGALARRWHVRTVSMGGERPQAEHDDEPDVIDVEAEENKSEFKEIDR